MVGVLVGVVVDSWIVDASILCTTRASSLVLHQVSGVCGAVFVVKPLSFDSTGDWLLRPFGGCGCLLFLLSVCLASYEGHMVDALASRADEGRTSLR